MNLNSSKQHIFATMKSYSIFRSSKTDTAFWVKVQPINQRLCFLHNLIFAICATALSRGTRLTHDKTGCAIQQMVTVFFSIENLFLRKISGVAGEIQGRSSKWGLLDRKERTWVAGGKVGGVD